MTLHQDVSSKFGRCFPVVTKTPCFQDPKLGKKNCFPETYLSSSFHELSKFEPKLKKKTNVFHVNKHGYLQFCKLCVAFSLQKTSCLLLNITRDVVGLMLQNSNIKQNPLRNRPAFKFTGIEFRGISSRNLSTGNKTCATFHDSSSVILVMLLIKLGSSSPPSPVKAVQNMKDAEKIARPPRFEEIDPKCLLFQLLVVVECHKREVSG